MTQKNWDRRRISLTVTAALFAVVSLGMAGPMARLSNALGGALGKDVYNVTLLILELFVALGLGFFLLAKLKTLRDHTPAKLALWAVWVGAVIVAEHWNTSRIEHVHYLQYACLGALLWPVFRGRWRLPVVVLVGCGVGLLDEVLQGVTKGRGFDWADAAYDALGVLGGVLYFWSVTPGTEGAAGRVKSRSGGAAALLCAVMLLGAAGPAAADEPIRPLPDPAPAIAAFEVPPGWLGRHPDPAGLPGLLPGVLDALAAPLALPAAARKRAGDLLMGHAHGLVKLEGDLCGAPCAPDEIWLKALAEAPPTPVDPATVALRESSSCEMFAELESGLLTGSAWHLDRQALERAVGEPLAAKVWSTAVRAALIRRRLGVWLAQLTVDERRRIEQTILGAVLPTKAGAARPDVDLGLLRAKAEDLVSTKFWLGRGRTLTTCAAQIGRLSTEALPASGPVVESPEDCVRGDVLFFARTVHGPVIVGGPGRTEYLCADPLLIVDVGGDDTYRLAGRPIPAWQRIPVSVVVDLAGDDRYLAEDPGLLGGGFFGVSVLLDRSGDDTYMAHDIALGAGAVGQGVLIDEGGNDSYQGRALTQGAAILGLGWLRDGGGNDHYRAGILGQGAGGLLGTGTLLDRSGNDEYSLGALVADFREPDQGTVSYGQGYGFGHRELGLAGGAGWLFDLAGHDTYQASYFAQGAATFFGLGVLYDGGGGGDRYLGRRYVQGAGVHMGAGLLLDEAGNDLYEAFGVAQGCGHDQAVGLLVDGAGNDRYDVGFLGQGAARAEGLGILLDGAGQDRYWAGGQGTQGAQAAGEDPRRQSIGLLFELLGRDFYTGKGRDGTVWRDAPGRSGGADLE